MKNTQDRFPVFHVPHDGVLFPKELMESVCIPKEEFFRCHGMMRDKGTLQMVPHAWRNPDHTVYFPISRLLCDVERFLGPEEPMERIGMGFCYERAFDGKQIKTVTEELRQKTLYYYRIHHDQLDRMCASHPQILLLDLHSFSDEIVPGDQLCQDRRTPDICLGVDGKFNPENLAFTTERILRFSGFTTARNYPYSGSLVPDAVLNRRTHCDCASIMLEWNRRAYCDEKGTPDADKIKHIQRIIRQIADACVTLD